MRTRGGAQLEEHDGATRGEGYAQQPDRKNCILMPTMKTIDPYLPSGFRDYLPEEATARTRMFDAIRSTFEAAGFLAIDTPRIEREAVLTGGDASFDKQIFKIAGHSESDPLALRFDLTVPLARFVALHRNDLSFPFKRYQIGMVWRAEHAQAGRYREFAQCDADIIGSKDIFADAEIIALAYHAFRALGVGDFKIAVSNRKVLNGIAAFAGFSGDRLIEFFRKLDKSDSVEGKAAFSAFLKSELGDEDQREFIQQFLKAGAGEAAELAAKVGVESDEFEEGMKELTELSSALQALGVSEGTWNIDFSIVRGLGYYTGMVFETFLAGKESFGSVCSGGRYDNLVSRFGGAEIAGVGMSIGIDRLFAAVLEEVSAAPSSRVIILPLDGPKAYAAELTAGLRAAGMSADIYLGNEENLKGQLAYAVKNNFRVAIIAGPAEVDNKVVQVKDLDKRTQEEVSRDDVVVFVSDILTK